MSSKVTLPNPYTNRDPGIQPFHHHKSGSTKTCLWPSHLGGTAPFSLPRVSSSSCPQHPEHSLEKGCLQTPICSLITLCHVGSRPWGSRSLSPRKARLLAQGRLSSSILPTTQVCASSSQQDFYFHNFVIISGQNCEQRR